MKNYSIAIVAIIIFIACGNSISEKQNNEVASNEKQETTHEGEILLKKNCQFCHHPTKEKGRIAPPMAYVKEHYIKEGTSQEEFTTAFIDFINEPTKEKAKMRGAVANFGLMPKQSYPRETLEKIADYIYNFDLESPENPHRKNHGRNKHSKQQNYEEIGLEYALSTKSVLGSNLMSKIKSEGTIAALEFCNIHAIPLTDSMSQVHQATIKRVSDRPRNQNNRANIKELALIEQFKQKAASNEEQKAVLVQEDGKVYFYFPILTNSMCLQCHGKENVTIQKLTLEKIATLYPDDEATGYSENELRGLWKVIFDQK